MTSSETKAGIEDVLNYIEELTTTMIMKRFNQNEKEETQYPLFLITILAFL